MDKELNKFKK